MDVILTIPVMDKPDFEYYIVIVRSKPFAEGEESFEEKKASNGHP